MQFDEKILQLGKISEIMYHTVNREIAVMIAYCGNYWNSLSHIFDNNSWK